MLAVATYSRGVHAKLVEAGSKDVEVEKMAVAEAGMTVQRVQSKTAVFEGSGVVFALYVVTLCVSLAYVRERVTDPLLHFIFYTCAEGPPGAP